MMVEANSDLPSSTNVPNPGGVLKYLADAKCPFLGITKEEKLHGLRKMLLSRNAGQSQIDDVSLFNVKEVGPSTSTKTPSIINLHISDIGNNACFFSIKDKKAYTLRNTQKLWNILNTLIESHPDGWLVTSDENHQHYLLELLPQIRRIQLPNTVLLSDGELIRDPKRFRKVMVSVVNPRNHQDDNLMVMLLYESRKLAFWRLGAGEWIGLDGEDYSDAAFYDNTLYALKIVGRFDVVSVEAWEFSTIGPFLPEKNFSFELHCLSGCMEEDDYYYHATRLLASPVNGDILVLAHGGTYRDDPYPEWSILKVDVRQRQCIQIDTLNGQALLLNKTSSKFVSPKDVERHGYKPNSIYYVNWWEVTNDIQVRNYGMEDGEIQHIWNSGANLDVGTSWISPTTL